MVPEAVLPPCCFNNYRRIIRKRSPSILLFIRPPTYPQSSWNRTTRYSPPMLRWITWTVPSSSTTKPCTTFVPGIERNSRKKYLSLIYRRVIILSFPKQQFGRKRSNFHQFKSTVGSNHIQHHGFDEVRGGCER